MQETYTALSISFFGGHRLSKITSKTCSAIYRAGTTGARGERCVRHGVRKRINSDRNSIQFNLHRFFFSPKNIYTLKKCIGCNRHRLLGPKSPIQFPVHLTIGHYTILRNTAFHQQCVYSAFLHFNMIYHYSSSYLD